MTGLTAGLGLKPEHYGEALTCRSAGMWFEVHAENYMVDGGPRRSWLEAVRREHPLSLHGVSLSLAGSDSVDPVAVASLTRLVRELEPALVSEHLAWSRFEGSYLPDLLPFPRSAEALRQVCANVSRVQDAIGRSIAIENPSHYLALDGHDFEEVEFLTHLVRRTGCSLLLDINNVFVSARNTGTSAERGAPGRAPSRSDPRTTSFDRFARRCRRAGGMVHIRAVRCARRASADPRRMGCRAARLRRADGRT